MTRRRSTLGCLLALAASGCGGAAPPNATPAPAVVGLPAAIGPVTQGIEPVALRLSADGYMLDFRYRVTDPAAAGPLVEKSIRPVLHHRKSGARLMVPALGKVGALRSGLKPETGRVYFILFANPGRLVAAGDAVAVQLGPTELPELVVE